MLSISSSRLYCRPHATLKIRPLACRAAAAARFPRTTFSTYVKSRDWPPSPNTVGRLPANIDTTNFGITAEYSPLGS